MRKIEKPEIRKVTPGKLMDTKSWIDPMCGPMLTGK
jgi:hypothetical protein